MTCGRPRRRIGEPEFCCIGGMPRRLPGQSIREKKEKLTDEKFVPYFFAPVILWVVFLVELWHSLTKSQPSPRFSFIVAGIATVVSLIGFCRLIRQFRNLSRGERGELSVAEALDELRKDGYRVIHDIVREGFNIDHVLVGPAGVFAIETKFRSGQGVIEFRNGEGLFVGGRQEEGDPLKQARSNARDVNRLIRENCGVDEYVKPVLVYCGDWKVKNAWRDTDARVFTQGTVGEYVRRQQPAMTRCEIELIASHLERSARG